MSARASPSARHTAEVVLAVAPATVLVAALDSVATRTGPAVVYLPAAVAALLLEGSALDAQLDAIAARVAPALGVPVRLERTTAPAPREGERSVPVARGRRWAHLPRDGPQDGPVVSRVLHALAAIFDVADERERVATRAAAAESAQRVDVAKTAVLHAVSHDLRSPLTAITTAASGLDDERLRAELVAVLRDEST